MAIQHYKVSECSVCETETLVEVSEDHTVLRCTCCETTGDKV